MERFYDFFFFTYAYTYFEIDIYVDVIAGYRKI